MMVIIGCRPPWHSNSASILLDDNVWPSRVNRWAAHEMMHAAFFYADHIVEGDPNAQYYTNPGFCSMTGGNQYIGGMSYCYGPEALFSRDFADPWIVDDYDMMRNWYP